MSGAFGRGSYRSVVAGTQNDLRRATFYPCAYELIQLHKAHKEVIRHFYVRDKVFDNKFPGTALANGLFKFVPNRRESYHMRELMESIRRRSIWMHRIKQQREINAKALAMLEQQHGEGLAADAISFTTPDSDAYFAPQRYQDVANSWPNYWQHPSVRHVVPKPRWRRHQELDGAAQAVGKAAHQVPCMSGASGGFARFWEWCTQNGIVSKRLLVRQSVCGVMPQLSLHADQPIRSGDVVLTVPYLTVLNAQTVRGDMRPQAVPPLRAMCRYLTRRTRVDVTTAQALWLAGCLSCYTRLVAQGYDLEIAPLLSPSLLPELPSPFSEAHVGSYPAILDGVEGLGDRAARQLYLKSMESQVEVQLRATHAALRFYQSRRSPRIPSKLVPTLNELRIAHRTVLQRSIMLPVDCVASSPGDVADLFEKRPELDAIPSLVPVVDIIRSPAALRTSQHAAGPSSSDPTTSAGSLPTNCALYTCVQAAFLSSGTRRRVLLETSPLSNRRVVVCATKEISAGEELLMSYGS